MKIVVIGGSGLIGSKLVPKLPEPRHDTLSASPSPDVDTLTGEGLPEALDGAAMVVDVSNSSSFDDEAVLRFFFDTSTRNLLAAEAVAGVSHQFRLDDIVRRRLEENHHPRDVIVDPWAPYFGAKLSERTVVPDYTGFAISDALAADHPAGRPRGPPRNPWVPGNGDRTAALPSWAAQRPALGISASTGSTSQRTARRGTGGHLLPLGVRRARQEAPQRRDNYYVSILSNSDDLRGCFGWYRALDTTIAQDQQRNTSRLTMPVLATGGAASFGEDVGDAVKLVADDVHSVVIPGTGHFVAEEAPDEMLAALTAFAP